MHTLHDEANKSVRGTVVNADVKNLRTKGTAKLAAARPARDRRAVMYVMSLVFDLLAVVGGYLVALAFREEEWLEAAGQPLILLALPIFLMFEIGREVQSVEALESRSLGTTRALAALAGTALVIVGLTFFLKIQELSRIGFTLSFVVAAAFIILGKLALDWVFRRLMGGTATSELMILDGLEVEPQPGMDLIDLRTRGLSADLSDPHALSQISSLLAPYDRVVVACQFDRRPVWATILRGHDVGGEILLDRDLLVGAVAVGRCGNEDTLILSRGPINLINRIQKRAFDVAISLGLLILLSPLLLLVALALKLEGSGPVLFKQTRVGLGNRLFSILKFRSMREESTDEEGRRSASRDDDRITPVGRFIRRTSIDELPQLINVLRGDMSIVGPRPHALGSLAGDHLFWEATDGYWLRHALKPGITGLAQVRGFRGATPSKDDVRRRVRADLEYLTNWSLWGDVLILLKTFRVVVHENAF